MIHEIQILQTFKVTNEEISDIIDTALYGGINYWCAFVEPLRYDNGLPVGIKEEDWKKIKFLSEIVGYGGTLIFKDIESSETWNLSVEQFLEGLKQYCQQHNKTLESLLENYDAVDADCIIQYALFGNIEFS
jgi:hypothetical protein